MLGRLCSIAERVCASMAAHMRREEAELFPLLERRLCHAQQRSLLWRTLRAMPLRLLERVMPWIVGERRGSGDSFPPVLLLPYGFSHAVNHLTKTLSD